MTTGMGTWRPQGEERAVWQAGAVALLVVAGCITGPRAAGAPLAVRGVVFSTSDNVRLIDNNGDDIGDSHGTINGPDMGLGENNGGTPGSDEGRWWMPFDPAGSRARFADADVVDLSVRLHRKNAVGGANPHDADVYGLENRTSTTAVNSDYEAPASLVVDQLFSPTTPNQFVSTNDVSAFATTEAGRSGSSKIVFRAQLEPSDLPDTDGARDNYLPYQQKAEITQVPRLTAYREVPDDAAAFKAVPFTDFTFTTATANGAAPPTGNWAATPPVELFVRERVDNQNALKVQAFLDFDLSAIGTQPIEAATLSLHQYHKLNNVNEEVLYLGLVQDAWDLGANVPIYNEPIVSGSEFAFGVNGINPNFGPATDLDFLIDVTEFVTLWQQDPSSNNGLRLRIDAGSVGAAFDYFGQYAPVLTVYYAVPEPSAAMLVLCGLLSVTTMARRRH